MTFSGDPAGGSFTMDDLEFVPSGSAPEPPVLALMLAGIVLLMRRRPRRPNRYYVLPVAAILGVAALGVNTAYAVQSVESVVATPALVFIDTPTNVRFSAKVAPDDNLLPQSVRLLSVGEDGSAIAVKSAMYDDGTNGDSVAGDLNYNVDILINVSEPGVLRYRVSVAYRGSMRRVLSDIVVVNTNLEPFFTPSDPASITVGDDGVAFPVNEVLVGLQEGASMETAQEIAASVGGEVAGFAPSGNMYQLKVPTTTAEELHELIEVLLSDSRVLFALPNFVNDSILVPNSAGNDAEWLSAPKRTAYDQIDAFDAWDLLFDSGHGTSSVVVGVLDSGFQNHPEFSGVSFVSSSPRPDSGWPALAGCLGGSTDHGTAVVGVIGAANSGGSGGSYQTNGILAGVTDGSSDGSSVPYQISARNLGDSSMEAATHVSKMVAAGSKVINMSFGSSRKSALPVNEIIVYLKAGQPAGTADTLAASVGGSVKRGSGERYVFLVPATTDAEAEEIANTLDGRDEVATARTQRQCFGASDANFNASLAYWSGVFSSHPDVMFTVAAGNDSIPVSDAAPAAVNAENVLTVGATDDSSDPATAGATSFTNTGGGVDIAAPGLYVYAPTNYTAPLDDADYGLVSGTSFSAPVNAGAVGLMLATDNTLTPKQVRKILLATATENANVSSISGKILNLGVATEFLLTPVDVFLVVDTSGSFYDDLSSFKAEANTLVNALEESGLNIHMGLAHFEDCPIYPWGDPSYGDRAYQRLLDVQAIDDGTGNMPIIQAINGLSTRNGYDWPESQLVALYQAATGAGQVIAGHSQANIPSGQGATFRTPAAAALSPVRIVILWTDADFHTQGDSTSDDEPVISYPGPTLAGTISALNGKEIKVIGISGGGGGFFDLQQVAQGTNTVAPADGVDCDANGTIDVAEGQPIVCAISSNGSGISEAIVATVIAVARQ